MADANGNVTAYDYDGHDRRVKTTFPDGNPGLPPGGDYETFAYDVAGNMVQKRTRAGDILQFAFDALSRQTAKTGAAVIDTATSYDLTGRPVLVSDAGGQSLAHAYDGAGRRRCQKKMA